MEPRTSFGQRIARTLLRAASWPLALLILFEEWGWVPLRRALFAIVRAMGLQRLEPRIRSLPPYPRSPSCPSP